MPSILSPRSLAVTAVAAASSWLVLSYQVALRNAVPIGADTPSHLWRTRIVHALGLRGLFGSSPFEYHANSANPDRIGLPVLGSLFGATCNVGPWRLMFVASAARCRRPRVLGLGARAGGGRAAVGRADLRGGRGMVDPVRHHRAEPPGQRPRRRPDRGRLAAVAIRLARGEAGVWQPSRSPWAPS